MVRLAEAGYHAVVPDQRGFGRTTGRDTRYEADLTSFSTLNMIRDALAPVSTLGYHFVNVIGHDAGSPIAAWCALVRPDVFRSVAMMSAPFGGPPSFPMPTTPPSLDGRLLGSYFWRNNPLGRVADSDFCFSLSAVQPAGS